MAPGRGPLQFRAEVKSSAGYPLQVSGRINHLAGKLSFTLLHGSSRRVFALDLGSDHHNPSCQFVGEKHLHTWTDDYRDKLACVPEGITAEMDDPVAVWQQFCTRAKIEHRGTMVRAPPAQLELPT